MTCRLVLLRFACALMLGGVGALRAQTTVVVLHSYALTQSLADQNGGPALVSLGGSVTPAGYVFAANQGLQLPTPLTNPANYTIQLNFAFDSISGYRKILDFQSLGPDSGFYFLNGNLNFFPITTSAQVNTSPEQAVEVVLTRDSATQQFTGYVNGTQVLNFTDTSGLAVLNAPATGLYFFVDDNSTGQGEASAGTVTRIRLFDTVLAAPDVLSLAQNQLPLSIPEPSTWVLLLTGGGLLLVCLCRQPTRSR